MASQVPELAERYLRFLSSREGSFQALWDLERLIGEDPSAGLQVLIAVIQRADESKLGDIGAGPLNELIVELSKRPADDPTLRELVTFARKTPAAKKALANVMPDSGQDHVWTEIDSVMFNSIDDRWPGQ